MQRQHALYQLAGPIGLRAGAYVEIVGAPWDSHGVIVKPTGTYDKETKQPVYLIRGCDPKARLTPVAKV